MTFRCLQPWASTTLLIIGLAMTFLGMAYPWTVVALLRHERAALRHAVCVERLRALKARSVVARSAIVPSDPCLAISILNERNP